MSLLILYFCLAIVVSFICSILESVLLSVNMSYISLLEKENPKTGLLLKKHKLNINKSIASILILNTLANTLGAAGVGAQAGMIFGYTMNRMAATLALDERGQALVDAAYQALGYRKSTSAIWTR